MWMAHCMDVFGVRDRLIEDYREFTGSFVDIHGPKISEQVAERMEHGYQWPDPWLSLNPTFASGGTITELEADGLLQPECERIFRLKESDQEGPVLRLHQHQRDAVEAAHTGSSYVLTTGTGSGKSLAYIVPIVDRVLAAKTAGTYRPGIKAIVVYPMNALANSQLRELEKFLTIGYPGGPPVTFDRYTGQESAEARARIIASPPDILLTNYVMLELVLTRPRDRGLVSAAEGLWFLVLDELHTYRGRQGADVAMLVRRLRDICAAPAIQCVGTSATMTTEGDASDQREAVATVASTLFGVNVEPEHVIGETLERTTDPAAISAEALRRRITDPKPPADYGTFATDPLAAWIEESFGFEQDAPAEYPRRRRRPLTLPTAAEQLAKQTGEPLDECIRAIKDMLHAGSQIISPSTGRPAFAFRLHQFLSKGDNVYVTLESPAVRHVTSTYQVTAPGGEGADGSAQRILVPTAFCRECGQDYLVVNRSDTVSGRRYTPRQDHDASGGDEAGGYLFISDDQPWPESVEAVLADARLPYSWLTHDPGTGETIDPARLARLPEAIQVDVTGLEVGPGEGTPAAYVPSPFRFCLRCRTSYEQARGSDFAKLAKLSAEGRSSAMSLITASIVRTLRRWDGDLDPEARDQFAALLPIVERVLGPEHPDNLTTRTNLALWTGEAGDAAGARDQLAALLPIVERVLGSEHPDTLHARFELADHIGAAGDAAGARDQLAALLPIVERVLGPEHPTTLATRRDLALWTGTRDAAGARDQLAALLPIVERVLGSEHPDTLYARAWLALSTEEAGDTTGARDQLAALLPIVERVLGPEHPDTLAWHLPLARCTGEAGDAAGARDQLAALLPIAERVLGPEDPNTLATRRSLGYWTQKVNGNRERGVK
jgi:hypothetical protein